MVKSTTSPYDQTLSDLSSLLQKTTKTFAKESRVRKAKDILQGIDDLEIFEAKIMALKNGLLVEGSSSEDSEKVCEGEDESEGMGGEEDTEDEAAEGEEFSDKDIEMDPRRELELLDEQVEDDEDDDVVESEEELMEELEDGTPTTKRKQILGSSDSEEDDPELDGVKQVLSSYERKKQKLQREIEEIEEENVAPKPWLLSGEAKSGDRPSNSLLEEVVDFEHATKVAPEITEAVTATFEEIIRNRIREKAWDDPPMHTSTDNSKEEKALKRQLNEKNGNERDSLAKVYEGEAMVEAGLSVGGEPRNIDSKTKSAHAEITKLLGKISRTLDEMAGKKIASLPSFAVDFAILND